MDPRPAFERTLSVLEPSKLVAIGGRALLGLGILGIAASMLRVFPPGVFGFHAAVVGLLLVLGGARNNLWPTKRSAPVRAGSDGVAWGDRTLKRSEIHGGYFQPRAAASIGSSVRLVSKRGNILFEAEATEGEANELLRALGLDAGSRRAEFRGSSPIYATLGRQMAFAFAIFGLMLVPTLGGFAGVFPLAQLLFIAGIVLGVMPSRIEVGVDGILVRWYWRKTFLPMSEIDSFFVEDDRIIHIRLRSGKTETLHTSMRRKNHFGTERARQHRDAVHARMREAFATFHERGPVAEVSALVGRGGRAGSDWLDALRKLRQGADGGYRTAVVREEDLFRVVEDPSAPADARAGAAHVLRSSIDQAGKARIRVVAEATASPKLRVALDAVAGDAPEESVEAAMQALAEGRSARP